MGELGDVFISPPKDYESSFLTAHLKKVHDALLAYIEYEYSRAESDPEIARLNKQLMMGQDTPEYPDTLLYYNRLKDMAFSFWGDGFDNQPEILMLEMEICSNIYRQFEANRQSSQLLMLSKLLTEAK